MTIDKDDFVEVGRSEFDPYIEDLQQQISQLEKEISFCDSKFPKYVAITYDWLIHLIDNSMLDYHEADEYNRQIKEIADNFAGNCSCIKK